MKPLQILLLVVAFVAGLSPSVFAQACSQPSTGLLSWWPGEGNGSDIISSQNVTLLNGVAFSTGVVGQAFSFDGVDDRADVAVGALPNIAVTGQFTVDFWFKPASLTGTLFQRERSYVYLDNGVVKSYIEGTETSTGVSVSTNQWTHVALTYNNGLLKIYVNGVLSGSASRSLEDQSMFKTGIGYNSRFDTEFYSGLIDEVDFYGRALAASEIQALYAGSLGKCNGQATPPTASAGADFSVDEGRPAAMLDGSGSYDPDGDSLTYAWTQLPGGTPVLLSDASVTRPTFNAPNVAVGGETLSFELTVTANGESATDTVNVTVVNINHTPVADAGADQSVAEGSPVTLHGEASFDADGDETSPSFTYTWVQVGGSPTVAFIGAHTRNPSFLAPTLGATGAPGVVAMLVFQLRVDDTFTPDAPAPGFTFANVVDSVTVDITNVNNIPTADAGADQTVDEHSAVALNANGSDDPDSDLLTYAWVKLVGPPVTLSGAATAVPSFTAPFVGPGGADVTFRVTVNDGYGGVSTDTVVVHVQNINDPPLASAARPTVAVLWPPNHGLVTVGITGVSDPNNNATITITGVTQDEPTNGLGDGDTAIDAVINANGTVLLRAERAGTGNGRVYRVAFTAADLEGSTSGVVVVTVPRSAKEAAIDNGQNFDSTH